MKDTIDELLSSQQKELDRHRNSTFWSRNKKLILVLVIALGVLWVFTVGYAYYWSNYWLPQNFVELGQ